MDGHFEKVRARASNLSQQISDLKREIDEIDADGPSYPKQTAIAHLTVVAVILKHISLAEITTGQTELVEHTMAAIELLEKFGGEKYAEVNTKLTQLFFSYYLDRLALPGHDLRRPNNYTPMQR
ncbi:MAG: hypothetical protein AAGA30_02845 [Planctomycetota bacterium]